MKLFIDTSERDEFVIGVGDDRFKKMAEKEKTQILLLEINKYLEVKNLSWSDISEIEVFAGPGSYTGIRVGVAIANALGWALSIPVNGKNVKIDGPIEPIYA